MVEETKPIVMDATLSTPTTCGTNPVSNGITQQEPAPSVFIPLSSVSNHEVVTNPQQMVAQVLGPPAQVASPTNLLTNLSTILSNNNNSPMVANHNLVNTTPSSHALSTTSSSGYSSSSSHSSPQSSLFSMQSTADYLAQLLKDKKQLQAFPNVFLHIDRILDDEVGRVRSSLFQINGVEKKPLMLPEPDGPIVQQQEKVYVPIKDHPDYNFVGRILGPRGMTAKQLEQETGCKIMVRGRGSMRDKKKEESNRGKPNWEHLSDELHVLITVEDTANRAAAKIQRAVDEIRKLLVPVTDGEDELKKRQLMELAIINGTYRDSNSKHSLEAEQIKLLPQGLLTTSLRTPTHHTTPLGAPLIISPRHLHVPTSVMNGSGPPPLLTPAEAGLMYASPYDFHHHYAALSPLLAEYPMHHHTQAGNAEAVAAAAAAASSGGLFGR